MKIESRIIVIIMMFFLVVEVGKCEADNDAIQKWQDWRRLMIMEPDEEELKWDGITHEIVIPEDPDFWWTSINDIFASSYICSPSSGYYAVIDGVLFSADLKILYKYPPMKSGWYYQIPSTVEYLEEDAFQDTYYLQEVVVTDSVRMISSGAFRYSGIKRLHLPPSVKEFDIETISLAVFLEEIIVKDGSDCWRELKIAEESLYTDFFNRNIVKTY